jgi:hypothetical protein
MTEPAPALAPSEWAGIEASAYGRRLTLQLADGHSESITLPLRGRSRLNHAAAAVTLDGQDFGFSHDDVTHIYAAAQELDRKELSDHPEHLRAIGRRIQALLRPS